MFNLHAPFTKHLGYLSSGTDMVAIVTIESIERKKKLFAYSFMTINLQTLRPIAL